MTVDISNWFQFYGTLYYFQHNHHHAQYVLKSQDFSVNQSTLPRYQAIHDGNYLKITDWHGNVFWENVVEWVKLKDEEKKLWKKHTGDLFFDFYPIGMSPMIWKKVSVIEPQIELYVKP